VAESDTRWLVYVLRCSDGSLYTGITNDLGRRVEQHLAGRASRFTRGRLPVTVAFQESQPNPSAALKREVVIKALSRSRKESLISSAEQTQTQS
jgi:predicted GIY-YIG superfamily endonuclease